MVSAIERIAEELKGASDREEALASMLVWVEYASPAWPTLPPDVSCGFPPIQSPLIVLPSAMDGSYSSIPQKTDDSHLAQALAVQTLSAYASCAAAFVVIAPEVCHADTGELCNLSSYQRRMWCRAEQFCHILRNGVDHMWLATAPRQCVKLAPIMATLRQIEAVGAPIDLDALALEHSGLGRGTVAAKASECGRAVLKRVNSSAVLRSGGESSKPHGDRRKSLANLLHDEHHFLHQSAHGTAPPHRRATSFALAATDDDLAWLEDILCVFQGEATREADKFELVVPILGLYAELQAIICTQDGDSSLLSVDSSLLRRIYSRIQLKRALIFPPTPRHAASHAASDSPDRAPVNAAVQAPSAGAITKQRRTNELPPVPQLLQRCPSTTLAIDSVAAAVKRASRRLSGDLDGAFATPRASARESCASARESEGSFSRGKTSSRSRRSSRSQRPLVTISNIMGLQQVMPDELFGSGITSLVSITEKRLDDNREIISEISIWSGKSRKRDTVVQPSPSLLPQALPSRSMQ